MASDQDESRVFPIGHYVGAYLDDVPGTDSGDSVGGDGAGRHHEIRLGTEVVELADPAFRLWALAHGVPDQLTEETVWGRRRITEAAATAGATGIDAGLDDLIARGLLAEVTPDLENTLGFASRHRLAPLMLGLGNTAEEPGLYAIGVFGQPIIQVSNGVYSLWEWAHLDRDLWSACQTFAEVEAEAGAEDPDETDPEKILLDFVVAVHGLLAVNAAYLDQIVEAAP